MENSKGQTIFLSVIGIATLLVAIIGATFAWFSVEVAGNNEAESVYVETMQLGSVTYTDNNEIVLTRVKPITTPTAENRKTFTVAQTDSAATETLSYTISLDITENGLASNDGGNFVHSLTGTSSKTSNAGTLVTVAETEVPTATADLGTGTLIGLETHTYTYTIYLKNVNSAQPGQGQSFAGKIQVSLDQTSYSGS